MQATQEILGQILSSDKAKAKVLASITVHGENSGWLESRYDKLRGKYKGMFVAVHKGKIIAADRDFDKVMMKIESESCAEVAALALIADKRPLLIL
jgi:hypothetical protein